MARTLGGLARKARRSWSSLKRSIDAEIRAEELKKPFEDIKKAKNELTKPVEDLKKPFEDFQKDLNKTAKAFKDKANESVTGDTDSDKAEKTVKAKEDNQTQDKADKETPAEASSKDG